MKTILYFILTLLTFVTLAFVPNSFAQDASPEYVVRVIYFLPNDQEPDPDIDSKLDTLMKDAQQFYADQMEAHGFDRKTFRFETDENENVVVHHVNGKFNDAYYQNPSTGSWIVWEEIEEQFDMSKNIYFLALGISNNYLTGVATANTSGIGGGNSLSGWALIPASRFGAAFHELGHAFGLQHDWRADANRIFTRNIKDVMTATFCAAEWLDVHRYFNPNQEPANDNTSVQMLPLSLAEPPATIRLQFDVTDPDGLHQAQLYRPFSSVGNDGLYQPYSSWAGVIACQGLSGNRTTVEFVTNELVGGNNIDLQVIDVHGNFTWHSFRIEITDLLPSPEKISIPDPNLAAAVRETLGLAPDTPITQIDMLRLVKFLDVDFDYLHAADLRGFQHATKMRELLFFKGERIRDITPLAGLTDMDALIFFNSPINDITSLAGLTNLTVLELGHNQITDVSPLTGLTKLTILSLVGNQISDITPLAKLTRLEKLRLTGNQISNITPFAGLTNLRILWLSNNQISDVSPLVELVNLEELHLEGNPIKDRKPLLELLEKNPDVKIYLKRGGEPLPVTLSHFRAERSNAGVILKWTTESEVDNAGFYIHRSETKDGEFKVVNPTMIQGAGTTGERNEYTWTDTTAKENTVYYYQIEDVSYAGVRKQLATVRLRGLVSASGKLATRWADLKRTQ